MQIHIPGNAIVETVLGAAINSNVKSDFWKHGYLCNNDGCMGYSGRNFRTFLYWAATRTGFNFFDLLKNGHVADNFNDAPLQLAILRRIQREISNQGFALLTAVSTRWGTQYKMLHSVQRSQHALSMYADEVATGKFGSPCRTVISGTISRL
jgi:hypothetical protein